MKRIITIAALLVLGFSTSFAQPMKWKKLADNVVLPYKSPDFGALATKDSVIIVGWQNAVLSTDLGNTWSILPLKDTTVYDVAIFDKNTFAICNSGGVFVSYDIGRTWQFLGPGATVVFNNSPTKLLSVGAGKVYWHELGKQTIQIPVCSQQLHLQEAADGALYMTCIGGLFHPSLQKSTDRGVTWSENYQLPAESFDSYSIICDWRDPNRIVLVNEDYYAKYFKSSRILVTSDAGVTWTENLQRPLGQYPNTHLLGNASQGCNDYFVGTGTEGILRSNDKGYTWQSIGGPLTPLDSRLLSALDDSTILAVDNFGSIWITDPISRPVTESTIKVDIVPFLPTYTQCDLPAISKITFSKGNECRPIPNVVSVGLIGNDTANFTIIEQFSSPISYPDSVLVSFTPDRSGTVSAQLQVTYSNGAVEFIDMSTTVSPRMVLSFTNITDINISTDTLGGDITIPIQLKKSTDVNAEFLLHYDTSYLEYRGTFDGQGIDHTTENSNGRVRIGYNPSIDTSLSALFSFFPIDSNCTSVRIDSLSSLDASACVVIENKVFTATICGPEGCGINTLSRFIRYGTAPEFTITPNPTRGTIILQSNIDIEGATIEIRNEVGAISYSSRSDIKKADGLSLDVSSLPSGAYILLVKGHGAGVPLVIMK